ncbi:MAG TPA: hypothetical protein VNA69_14230 [Thermoanaerobaculia bacterium]|nr:hypothetical protein [Thermoanaerobaculia bacterium]
MKTATALFVLLLAAGSALAQEATRPDYSRDTLMKLFVDGKEQPVRDSNMRFHVGAVEFGAIGTRWRFNYLPIMAPLAGTRFGVTREWPDAFSLLGTPIATPRRAWRTQRLVDAELKRIEKVTKPKVKIRITTE